MLSHEKGVVSEALSPKISAKQITENSVHVKINADAVQRLSKSIAEQFLKKAYSLSNWKLHELHPSVADDHAINFIFAIDTLNFSFWPDFNQKKFTIKYNGNMYTGYWSLVAAIKRAEEDGIPFTNAHYMASVTKDELANVFRSEFGSIPLLNERVKALNEAGRVLLEKFGGTFRSCIEQSNHDAVKLLKIVVENFTSFQDVCKIQDTTYSFLKRAQIVVADIWGCFEGKGLGYFSNIDELTMFADYRVPQTLEYFEVLSYSSDLKEKLLNSVVFPNGSKYEVEIRGCSIQAVEDLKVEVLKLLNEKSASKEVTDVLNSITLDFYLWDFARGHRKEMEHLPFHRTRCIYY